MSAIEKVGLGGWEGGGREGASGGLGETGTGGAIEWPKAQVASV